LSNTLIESIEKVEGGSWWHFQETPLMSSYLLAFVIGKFDFVEFKTNLGIKVRGYTPKGVSHFSAEYTKIAAEAIDLYEEYFQIKYPLPKLDLVSYH
jgi:puromycin-sensitive aminopeptidase